MSTIGVVLDEDRLRSMADDLGKVPGVRAVALGGSRARGTHRPDSDIDLGLYVEADVDLTALAEAASGWTGEDVEIAGRGGWGPWVDSGAWLIVDGAPVDLILRDVTRVEDQCARAARGEFAFHSQPGHPLGFLDVAYAGEVATGVPLCDPDGILVALAQSVTPYPDALRAAFIENLWQVDFLLNAATKGAKTGDAAYVVLCGTTTAMLIAHAWHAAAGQWVTNEKGLVPNAARLPIDTAGFSAAAAAVLGSIGTAPEELLASIAQLRGLPRPATPSD
ncbi:MULTISPECIES: nucleotidyltransferase domain-containing protein [unclassified Microbacterium]|uniref:nucleotidyltransferase domain-containing protein n=1 Tax=unclassified Microbacterium TaxID=2609290 RepID=UPI000DE2ACA2|nr:MULTISPECIES: nucleotidyltransferase domain-containing protein [unclassified Microbacterium]MCB8045814.1 nucleotidyltransferase domain-containing protein [Microbacterium oxydans]NYF27144.1 putative nucleotidyltransferase [Microbacterium sp. JAI119]RBO72402.1 nucleotidyltransferase domain-containing protein [Microbacterium sp. H6]